MSKQPVKKAPSIAEQRKKRQINEVREPINGFEGDFFPAGSMRRQDINSVGGMEIMSHRDTELAYSHIPLRMRNKARRVHPDLLVEGADNYLFSGFEALLDGFEGLADRGLGLSDEVGLGPVRDLLGRLNEETYGYQSVDRRHHRSDNQVYSTSRSDGHDDEYVYGVLLGQARPNLENQENGPTPAEQALMALGGLADEVDDCRTAAATPLLRAGSQGGAAIAEAMEAFRGSEALAWLSSASNSHTISQGSKSVLLAWISSPNIRASVMAEAIAHLEIYVKAGWAERDFDPKHPLPENKEQREAVKILRRLAHEVQADNAHELDEKSAIDLCRALDVRFSEVFIPVAIKHRGKGGSPVAVGLPREASERLRFDVATNQYQGAGLVDIVARSANDPHDLYVGSVTANRDVASQHDQHHRNIGAIQRAIDAGQPPFSKSDRIAMATLHAKALVPEKEDGRHDLRTNLVHSWRASGQKWDKTNNLERVDSLCLLQLFSLLRATKLDTSPDPVLRTRHLRFGAGNTAFDPTQSVEKIAVAVAEFLADHLEQWSKAMPFFRLRATGKSATLAQSNLILRNLAESVQGLMQHYASIDEDDVSVSKERRECAQKISEIMTARLPEAKIILREAVAQISSGPDIDSLVAMVSSISPAESPALKLKGTTIVSEVTGETIDCRFLEGDRAEYLAARQREEGLRDRQDRMANYISKYLSKWEKSAQVAWPHKGVLMAAANRFDDKTVSEMIKKDIAHLLMANKGKLVCPTDGEYEFKNCFNQEQLCRTLKGIKPAMQKRSSAMFKLR